MTVVGQALSQARGGGLQFVGRAVIPNEACHSELDSESMEGECKTYTDAESSSAWRGFSLVRHSELDSESVKAYNIDLWVKKGMSTLWQIPLILSCILV